MRSCENNSQLDTRERTQAEVDFTSIRPRAVSDVNSGQIHSKKGKRKKTNSKYLFIYLFIYIQILLYIENDLIQRQL